MTQYLPDQLVNTREAAQILGCQPSSLEHWRVENRGPKYYKHLRHVKYKVADLWAFVEEHAVPTADQK